MEWKSELSRLFLRWFDREPTSPEWIVLSGTWEGLSYSLMAESSAFSLAYLERTVAPSLFRALSNVTGEQVNKGNLKTLLERFMKVNFGASPDTYQFFGRAYELKEFQLDRRLVFLCGPVGIGKTVFARRAVELAKPDFDYVAWRCLDDDYGLGELIEHWVKRDLHITTSDKSVSVQLIDSLFPFLEIHRCLLILDNAQFALTDRQLFETLVNLIVRKNHRSCLLMISRDRISFVNSIAHPDYVRSFMLSELDDSSAKKILQKQGLKGNDRNFRILLQGAEGNPKVLELIANAINELYEGNIHKALVSQTWLFGATLAPILLNQYEALNRLQQDILMLLSEHPIFSLEEDEIRRFSCKVTYPSSISTLVESVFGLKQKNWLKSGKQGTLVLPFAYQKFIKRLKGKNVILP